MNQSLGLVSLVVRDYDEAIAFYVGVLGFSLVEDTFVPAQDKRWVVVAPPGREGARLLLARASAEAQEARIGNQAGGRVFLFLYTDDFQRDYSNYLKAGVVFVREPAVQPYGTVAVFEDLYGNLWDLVEPAVTNDKRAPVLEAAPLSVKPGESAAFESAFAEAQVIIASMPGYLSHELQRCIEREGQYLLLVRWVNVAAHEEGFRKSPGYQRWRALLHHFYDPFPTVLHYERVAGMDRPPARDV